ncbi:hypothetical protein Echvi_1662 [Echinicola vietnamensis DSM 17526]|uniref:Uncharacterized protein n=1 Tax=Echinicola vietnamensis (strain DSM 17526 / LMG 23754 / KMM 6221) TaxID=926556 RepID=L0FX94_ECHVK|nr:hypothetical protein Echvi_1662 [Echinicola vietnamensis DSM 17526]
MCICNSTIPRCKRGIVEHVFEAYEILPQTRAFKATRTATYSFYVYDRYFCGNLVNVKTELLDA